MVVAVDVRDDAVELWSRTEDGVEHKRDEDYRPKCYVDAPADALAWLADRLVADPKVVEAGYERMYTSLRDHRDGERSRVLAAALERPSEVATFAREVRAVHEPDGDWPPGRFRCYDVDVSPKFRYCLAEGVEPMPERVDRVHSLALSLPTHELAARNLAALACDGESLGRSGATAAGGRADERAVLEALATCLRDRDPDVLVLSSADLVPFVHERADALGVDCHLGRCPDHRRLAGANTYESYGRIGHSPARYDVPGRAIVDRSNSFFWHEGGLPGLFDLVRRSHKPLQETAWASIGTVFTAMQIREAKSRDVLVPWRPWEPEAFTPARTLHDADRGGVTFEPDVGFHGNTAEQNSASAGSSSTRQNVIEVDFASLYPSIMCVHDLSPETVRCACHDTDDVPIVGYSVCPDVEDPLVPSVLQKLVDDRAGFKAELAVCEDPARAERLESKISALKWILVTCFGYQGYRNSKFGRIEVHESINAYAREMLLSAKATLEEGGWRVIHGIVDSLWVTPRTQDPEPIEEVCENVTDEIGIALEYEDTFDWVAFVPRRDGATGALNRYVGARSEGGFKFRGIECRQRSTPAFVAAVQEDLVERLDEHREPEPVCDRLSRAITHIQRGDVPADELVIRTRATRALDDYDQETRTVAALERYRAEGVERRPGQDVRYVVVDDDRADRDRVRLPWESIDSYDADFYETLLVHAAESVLSPLGWDRERIRRYLADGRDLQLSAFE